MDPESFLVTESGATAAVGVTGAVQEERVVDQGDAWNVIAKVKVP